VAIACQVVGTSNVTLLSGSAASEKAVIGFSFCNYDTVAHKVTVWLVPNGGSAGDSNLLLKEVDIAATDTFFWDSIKVILGDGESLIALADGSVSSVVSWYQI